MQAQDDGRPARRPRRSPSPRSGAASAPPASAPCATSPPRRPRRPRRRTRPADRVERIRRHPVPDHLAEIDDDTPGIVEREDPERHRLAEPEAERHAPAPRLDPRLVRHDAGQRAEGLRQRGPATSSGQAPRRGRRRIGLLGARADPRVGFVAAGRSRSRGRPKPGIGRSALPEKPRQAGHAFLDLRRAARVGQAQRAMPAPLVEIEPRRHRDTGLLEDAGGEARGCRRSGGRHRHRRRRRHRRARCSSARPREALRAKSRDSGYMCGDVHPVPRVPRG
jgi:hypothetical protein